MNFLFEETIEFECWVKVEKINQEVKLQIVALEITSTGKGGSVKMIG